MEYVVLNKGFFFNPDNTKNSSLAVGSASASCLRLLKFPNLHHWQFIILTVASINEARSHLVLLRHQHLLLPSCQMWGDSRSHTDLSTGGGEDPPAVIFPQLLCVGGSAEHCQWRQCGPHVCAWPPALPQVGIHYAKIDFHLDIHKY